MSMWSQLNVYTGILLTAVYSDLPDGHCQNLTSNAGKLPRYTYVMLTHAVRIHVYT
jgi:hypothetical protein